MTWSTALEVRKIGTSRPGPIRVMIRDVASAATSEMIAAPATIRGSIVTGKCERKSASRVAFPATW